MAAQISSKPFSLRMQGLIIGLWPGCKSRDAAHWWTTDLIAGNWEGLRLCISFVLASKEKENQLWPLVVVIRKNAFIRVSPPISKSVFMPLSGGMLRLSLKSLTTNTGSSRPGHEGEDSLARPQSWTLLIHTYWNNLWENQTTYFSLVTLTLIARPVDRSARSNISPHSCLKYNWHEHFDTYNSGNLLS